MMCCMTPDVVAGLDDDASRVVAGEARAWFEANWNPDMSLGEWWAVLAESGWGFPTLADTPLRPRSRPSPSPVGQRRSSRGGGVGATGGYRAEPRGSHLACSRLRWPARPLPCLESVNGEIWCQLFSEPGSGSDLASLQTRAVRDGDQWVINGQKVWTSGAHIARYGILVARTNPELPKHQGLTYFVIDMDQPGIEVRPIREMTGRSIFNEVFLTDAVVPEENRLDEVGSGWGGCLDHVGERAHDARCRFVREFRGKHGDHQAGSLRQGGRSDA